MGSSVGTALLLTLMGAAGTAIGGILVVIQPSMSYKKLGALQGLAAGLMLSLSVMDLLPEAAEEIGFVAANACFYVGVVFFAAIVALIPEPDASMFADNSAALKAADSTSRRAKQCSPDGLKTVLRLEAVAAARASSDKAVRGNAALLCTATMGNDSTAAAVADTQQQSDKQLDAPGHCRQSPQSCVAPLPAAAGSLAAFEQQQQQQQLGLTRRRSCSTLSAESQMSAPSADMDVVVDELDSKDGSLKLKRQLLMSGVITAVGIALHNFPEGVAVYLAAQKSPAIGLSLAVAIGLHNVPEGVGVALPIYFATGSRWKGLQAAVLSGLAEPLAVILLGLFFPNEMNKHVIDCMLAGVGGIMAFLAFHELLPLAAQHAGKSLAVGCLFAGMALMSFNLHLLNTYVLAGLH